MDLDIKGAVIVNHRFQGHVAGLNQVRPFAP
jgi:hypothetical protein